MFRRTAPHLSDLTDGKVEFFAYQTPIADDPGGNEHRLFGCLHLPDEDEFLNLDDRLDLSLELQVVSELRRIAEVCRDLADVTERKHTGKEAVTT